MMIHNLQELYALDKNHTFTIYTLSEDITNETLEQNVKNKELLKRINIVVDNFIDENNIGYSLVAKLYRKIYRILMKKDVRENFYKALYENISETDFGETFVNSLKAVDLCLFNGGGYLQNSWKYHNIRFMAEIRLAKKINKPVVFMSNSVGPMAKYDCYTRETLPLVDYMMVRDGREFSWKLLEDYGIKNKINGPDDLFNVCDQYCKKQKDEEDYVMIEIMGWIKRAPKGKEYVINVLTQFINYLMEEENKNIRLINLDKSDILAKRAIASLFSEVNNPDRMKAMYEINNMYEVFEWYNGCSYSFSFKYHPVILALGAGKPCSAIITDEDGYYKSKLEGAFMNCGMDGTKHVMHIRDLNYQTLKELYGRTKYQVCDVNIKKGLNLIRKQYLKSINQKELFG